MLFREDFFSNVPENKQGQPSSFWDHFSQKNLPSQQLQFWAIGMQSPARRDSHSWGSHSMGYRDKQA
jgi:hypothetical protein